MPEPIPNEEVAFAKAASFLAAGVRSEVQLRTYLTRRGAQAAWIDGVVLRLREMGALKDDEVRGALQRRAERTGHGRYYLAGKLREHGLPPEPEGFDELAVCLEVAQRLRRQKPDLSLNALARRLQGRGFSAEVIHKVLRRLTSIDEAP